MMNKRWKKATLFFLTIALLLGMYYLTYAVDADSDSKTVDGVTASATATGYSYAQNNGYHIWTAWAGFSASLSKEGRNVGDSVNGRYSLYAYMPSSGVKQEANTFTLTIKRKLGFLWPVGDHTMGNIQRDDYWGSTNPGGKSKARSSAGSASTKQCKWPHSHPHS